MGGSKNKSPAQKQKSQDVKDPKKSGSKKGKKEQGEKKASKSKITVTLNESEAMKFIEHAKVLTVQELARQTGVKISAANEFLKKSLEKGIVKRVGGHSGHHIYQPASA